MPVAGGHRLLVLVPMRIEGLALGPGTRPRVGKTTLVIERVGVGLTNAGRAAGRLSAARAVSPPVPARRAPARRCRRRRAGRGLEPTLAPGDLIVAGRVIDSAGKEVAHLASAEPLAAELARLGLRARVGTVVSADHLVRGGERAELAGLGADVVDMESTAIVAASWGVPLAVLRGGLRLTGRGALLRSFGARHSRRAAQLAGSAAGPGGLGGGGRAEGGLPRCASLVLRRCARGGRRGAFLFPTPARGAADASLRGATTRREVTNGRALTPEHKGGDLRRPPSLARRDKFRSSSNWSRCSTATWNATVAARSNTRPRSCARGSRLTRLWPQSRSAGPRWYPSPVASRCCTPTSRR